MDVYRLNTARSIRTPNHSNYNNRNLRPPGWREQQELRPASVSVRYHAFALKLKNEPFLRDFLQNWSFETQKRSISAKLPSKLKHFCEISFKNEALKIKSKTFLRDFLQKWSFEDQKQSISAKLPSKMKLWRSKAKHFCETSFKNEALKIKNKAFLRNFLQKWSFEDQKTKHFCETSFKNEALKIKNKAFVRDFLQKWSFEDQKTKHFCETSFKIEALKIKNKAFVRDFLQKWSFEAQKGSILTRLPSKMTCWQDTWPQNSNTF